MVELRHLHLSGGAAICNEETHTRQDVTVFGFHAFPSRVFPSSPVGMNRGFSQRIVRQLAEGSRADAITKG